MIKELKRAHRVGNKVLTEDKIKDIYKDCEYRVPASLAAKPMGPELESQLDEFGKPV